MTSAQADNDPTSLDQLIRTEALWIKRRRKPHGLDPEAPVVGLALSGGGIRSATFSLGFLQALSARGVLRRFDYLSTVSGGSYVGSALGALFVPPEGRGSPSEAERPPFDAAAPLQSPRGTEAVRRLRDAGRYLTPAGTSDAFFGAAVVIRNWGAVQLAIGVVALLFFWSLIVCDRRLGQADAHAGASPTLVTLAWLAGMVVAGASLAYWLTRRDWIPGHRFWRVFGNLFFWLLIAALAYTTAAFWRPDGYAAWVPAWNAWDRGIATVLVVAIALHLVAELRHGAVQFTPLPADISSAQRADQRRRDLANPQLLVPAEDRVRTAHSRTLSWSLTVALGLLALLAIDGIGRAVPDQLRAFRIAFQHGDVRKAVAAGWPAVIAIVPPLLSWLASRRLKTVGAPETRTDPASWVPTILLIGGMVLLAAWLVLWSAAAHRLAERFDDPASQWAILGVLVAANLIESVSYSFINLSSLATFYAARLRRAYIGASSYGTPFTSVKEDDPEDAIRLENYYRYGLAAGAPLHLINVTVADTVPSGSNLVARDRKGKPMHLSAAGVVFGGDHPGETEVRGRRWGEELPLANWVAISGAAVSAAVGAGTTLGTSILATMVNTRLGYWWKQDRARTPRLFWWSLRDTVQSHLLSELRGAFPGTRRARWYLTDGGHFENTGVYALLQRALPFIVVSDNGADPNYRMEDLVRLIGRARTDLGIEIDFLGTDALRAKLGVNSPLLTAIGPLARLVRGSRDQSGGPVASLATVTYRSGDEGLLLLVKPRLTYLEPPEVLAYQSAPGCADFPQQTTGDQFFDEAQWEAYRRLGELAGEALFHATRPADAQWMPEDELPGQAPPPDRPGDVAAGQGGASVATCPRAPAPSPSDARPGTRPAARWCGSRC